MVGLKILFACSEAQPLIKTGGLAEIAGTLTIALNQQGQDVRLMLPGYPSVMAAVTDKTPIAVLDLVGVQDPVRVFTTQLPGSSVPVYVVDCQQLFARSGNPYVNEKGVDWPDNAARFSLYCRAISVFALDLAGIHWQPDIIHCNDWQTGLVPALLSMQTQRPATLYTVHNLAYQGVFPRSQFDLLKLPQALWSPTGLEFYGQMSCMKSGLVYADKISTVSPTYRQEILSPEYGCGLEGVLRLREPDLHGIINGVDYQIWDPRHDSLIPKNYTPNNFSLNKPENKKELQKRFLLPLHPNTPLLGMVGRLVEQKGVDLVLNCLESLMQLDIQLVILGSGDKTLETKLLAAAAQYPDKIAVHIGYSESFAHLIEAGADLFLMPSRFEPCGLNQIYSLRYGTLPIVRKTGGLADTVVDLANPAGLDATGFVFTAADPAIMLRTIKRALALFSDRTVWRKMMRSAMQQDFSWTKSALQYVDLYRLTIEAKGK